MICRYCLSSSWLRKPKTREAPIAKREVSQRTEHGTDPLTRSGLAWHGTSVHGTSGYGTARHGQFRHVPVWHGTARHVLARHGFGTTHAWHGTARHVMARGMSWHTVLHVTTTQGSFNFLHVLH